MASSQKNVAAQQILIVEDSLTQAEKLRHVLEQQHYRVHVAGGAAEALARLAESKPDLIISDVAMPEMDGYQLAERIKADDGLKEVPIILLTSLADPHDIVRGLLSGADNFITKPYEDAYLLSRVQYMLANRELRRTERVQVGVELRLGEQRYFITSERQQILDLLISTYETAVQKNHELIRAKQELQALNENLETVVQARTAALTAEIEERKRVEAMLRKAEVDMRQLWETSEQLREFNTSIVQTMGEGLVLEAPDGRLLFANDRAYTLLGYGPEELVGLHWSTIVKPAERGRVDAESQQRASGTSSRYETVLMAKDGAEIPAVVAATPFRERGHYSGTLAILVDIRERKQAERQIKRQLDQLAALRAVDLAITSSLDLRLTLNVFLDQVIKQLEVDAADVLLLEGSSQTLVYGAGRGFQVSGSQHVRLRLGEGRAGRAALERRLVVETEADEALSPPGRRNWLRQEGFVSYFGMPLIAKGQVLGILEVFHRTALEPDSAWLEFLEVLAGQAAIAIDSAMLFEGVQRSNQELMLAYDATIEGWSAALDLRDKETEGHTLRVTELTMQLARAMGLTGPALINVRRGALLHDIGKMGIPDHILLKPGPLTDDEWVIMRQHPIYAYRLLSPITFLQEAVDIPYCHHEKWDGSGYPRGLKEEQIPLAARVFAVVDVWDALRSDRPYRSGWPEARVREHIHAGRATHFDPAVVDAFLQLLASE